MTAQRQEKKARRPGIAIFAAGALSLLGCADLAFGGPTERVVADRHTGLAIGGYDPVAYFTDARPVPGDPAIETMAQGVVWRFANPDNRVFFVQRPDVYAPRFGGYDPVDVARGKPVAGNAQLWLVVGQRLYLFYRESNRDAFAADPARYLGVAEKNWPDLRDSLSE